MVNGQAVAFDGPREIHSGDEIGLGPFTVVRFEIRSGDVDNVPPVFAAEVDKASTPLPEPFPRTPHLPLTLPGEFIARASGPRERFGPYDVYGTIDQGRHDRVDAAMDRESHVPVALKRFMDIGRDAGVQERILGDAARSRRWQHPFIFHVLDFGVVEETPFVVAKLVDGITLTTARVRSKVDPALAAYVLGRACEALTYAQTVEPGFVHGSLSPRRIMLDRRGGVVLLNFGTAPIRTLVNGPAEDATVANQYVAPEILAGGRVLPWSDVFSLGIILYELIAGRPIETAEKESLPDLDVIAPGTPERLVSIARRAARPAVGTRFQNAEEMREELAAVLREMLPTYGAHMAAQAVSRIAAASAGP